MLLNNLEDTNVLFITLDSCRYDTAQKANIPTIQSLGRIKKAYTHATYTVPAHTAFFTGHLPAVFDQSQSKYYSESAGQLWRIKTGKGRDREAGTVFSQQTVLEGYRQLGFTILGAGGVTQFTEGSLLRNFFKKEEFMYFGRNLDEEPLKPRNEQEFPLNNLETIVNRINDKDKWFLFVNCPETHYPYDIGNGFNDELNKYYPKLYKILNLREADDPIDIPVEVYAILHDMQIKALEYVDARIRKLLSMLPKNKDILVIISGDHGENFGEVFNGRQRWGHLLPTKEVLEVPLLINVIKSRT
ncbi:sulfatase-like hydrolase/transferase [Candidatus Saccharibacteria bacterium]|jgi:membrane-anchored protein YejM (alkaline phosphatase superfamily)|nr:sulfatase-like hydrolase/transferase [Candidatus Saccharibacteria bacterium]